MDTMCTALAEALEDFRRIAKTRKWRKILNTDEQTMLREAMSTSKSWADFLLLPPLCNDEFEEPFLPEEKAPSDHDPVHSNRTQTSIHPSSAMDPKLDMSTARQWRSLAALVRKTLLFASIDTLFDPGTSKGKVQLPTSTNFCHLSTDAGQTSEQVWVEPRLSSRDFADATPAYMLLDDPRLENTEDSARYASELTNPHSSQPNSTVQKRLRRKPMSSCRYQLALIDRMGDFVRDLRAACEEAREQHCMAPSAPNTPSRLTGKPPSKSSSRREAASAANVIEALQDLESQARAGRFERAEDCIKLVTSCVANQDTIFSNIIPALGEMVISLRNDEQWILRCRESMTLLRQQAIGILSATKTMALNRNLEPSKSGGGDATDPNMNQVSQQVDFEMADAEVQDMEIMLHTESFAATKNAQASQIKDEATDTLSEDHAIGFCQIEADDIECSSSSSSSDETPLPSSSSVDNAPSLVQYAKLFGQTAAIASACQKTAEVDEAWRQYTDSDYAVSPGRFGVSCYPEYNSMAYSAVSTVGRFWGVPTRQPKIPRRGNGLWSSVKWCVKGSVARLVNQWMSSPIAQNVLAIERIRELRKEFIDDTSVMKVSNASARAISINRSNSPNITVNADINMNDDKLRRKNKSVSPNMPEIVILNESEDDSGNTLDENQHGIELTSDAEGRAWARQVTALLLAHGGCVESSTSVLDILTDVWIDFIGRIGSSLISCRESTLLFRDSTGNNEYALAASATRMLQIRPRVNDREVYRTMRSRIETLGLVRQISSSGFQGGFPELKTYVSVEIPRIVNEIRDAELRLKAKVSELSTRPGTHGQQPSTAAVELAPAGESNASPSYHASTDVIFPLQEPARLFGILNDTARLDILQDICVPRELVTRALDDNKKT